jgi:hypothetical protein
MDTGIVRRIDLLQWVIPWWENVLFFVRAKAFRSTAPGYVAEKGARCTKKDHFHPAGIPLQPVRHTSAQIKPLFELL